MTKLVGACQLLALRDHASAQEVLCLMLEWSLLEPPGSNDDPGSVENALPLQVATTLQSTESGRRRYFELCDRQLHLKELVRTIFFNPVDHGVAKMCCWITATKGRTEKVDVTQPVHG